MWSAVTRDGKVYGIPFCVNTYIFFYNEDLLSMKGAESISIPTTWKELIEEGKIFLFGRVGGADQPWVVCSV